MHSSRMRTARSLTVSRHILCMPPPQPCMPHHPPATMHAPQQPHMPPSPANHTRLPPLQPCMPPSNHACPLATMHSPQQPHMPPATTHTPRQPCTPPSNHTHPPCNHACGQTHTCKNITFANYVCGR